MGTLFHGDNLDALRRHVDDASVDLVYLDPPFQSGKNYSLLSGVRGLSPGKSSLDAEAFKDTWVWGPEAEASFAETDAMDGRVADGIRALRSILSETDLMAYLSMMAPRLVELRRVLKSTGSIYLHCDPTASHYLKVLMDCIFGSSCFRNEIVWRYRRWPTKATRFQKMHDILLFYAASEGNKHTFNTLYGLEKLADSTLKTFGTKKQKADFSSGHRKPGTENEETRGPPLTDFWDVDDLEQTGFPSSDAWEVGVIAPIAKERTSYPTQKPEKLLDRVVLASTNEGDVVLDPFCGSGTTLAVAERLKRKWLGMDSSKVAVDLVRQRMRGVDFVAVQARCSFCDGTGVEDDGFKSYPCRCAEP